MIFYSGEKVHTWNRMPRYEQVDLCLGVKNAEKVNVNCEGTGEKQIRGGQGGSTYLDH